jgi:CubicO group peptidase (beta-lactamase class C family)
MQSAKDGGDRSPITKAVTGYRTPKLSAYRTNESSLPASSSDIHRSLIGSREIGSQEITIMRMKTIVFIFLYLLGAVVVAAQSPTLPDTPAGKLVADYLQAFNSGDELVWREFINTHVAKSALEKVSIDERMKRYQEIRSNLGGFELRRVVESGHTSIQILAITKRGEEVQVSFELEPQSPYGLLSVRIERNEGPGDARVPGNNSSGQVIRNEGPRVSETQPNAGSSPVPKLVVRDDLSARVDQYLTRMTAFGFSGSVLIAKDHRILTHKAYGMADRANKVPNTTDTLFDTGSIAKQFTGAAIFKLEAMGKLRTSDVIGKFLENVPTDKQAITLDHLLRHRSGVMTAQSISRADNFGDRDARVRQILTAPLNFAPGERYQYTNAGYNLLAAIIEKVSGQSYQQFLYENLFRPAGMTSTIFQTGRFVVPGDDKKIVAQLYAGQEDNGVPLGRENLAWFFTGPGGILTTPGDFFKWHKALLGDEVLPPAAKRKYYELAEVDGTMRNTPRGKVISHGGGTTMGTGASLVRYLDAGAMIGVCINNSGEEFNELVTQALGKLIFDGEVQMPPAVIALKAEKLSEFAATYVLSSGGKLTAVVADGQLRLAASDAKGLEALFNTQATERNKKLEERTSAIVASYVKGQYEPLLGALITRAVPERLAAREQQLWKNWESSYGSFKGFAIIGTTPEPMDDAAVNVRLEFEHGAVITQYVWFPRGLDMVRVLQSAPGISFLPTSETEFVAYNLATGSLVRVTFNRDGGSAVSGLTLRAGDRIVTASR